MDSSIYDLPSSVLPDAGKWIRLLYIDAGQDRDDIVCSFRTAEIESPPEFAALSYTWGDPEPLRTITLEGQSVEVRGNCYYALWQLRQRLNPGYFWIDALCIDQSDLTEKNAQVQIMGRIYERAAVVFVSLGSHDREGYTKAVFDDLRGAPESHDEAAWEDFIRTFKRNRGMDYLLALRNSLDEVAKKPYWNRLWIVQEVLLAREVIILCGADLLSWRQLEQFEMRLDQYMTRRGARTSSWNPLMRWPDVMKVLGTRVRDSSPRRFSLSTLLRLYSESRCSNVLDRIYGLLYILERPKGLITGLVVDYNLSAWDLMKQTVLYLGIAPTTDHLVPSSMTRLLEALDIRSTDPAAQALIRERQVELQPRDHSDTRSSDSGDECVASTPTGIDSYIDITVLGRNVLELHLDENDIVTGIPSIDSFSSSRFQSEWFTAAKDSVQSGVPPLYMLGKENEIVGLIWAGAQTGDLLVKLWLEYACEGDVLHCCLVLRQHHGNMFSVVGQAVLLFTDQLHSDHCWQEADNARAFVLHFEIDDLIAWTAQGLNDREATQERLDLAAQRTVTRPSFDHTTSYAEAINGWLEKSRAAKCCGGPADKPWTDKVSSTVKQRRRQIGRWMKVIRYQTRF